MMKKKITNTFILIYTKVKNLSYYSKIGLFLFFLLSFYIIVDYFWIQPIAEVYALLLVGQSVVALQATVDFYLHNITECPIDPRVKPIDCLEWEKFFKDKIYPHSGDCTLGVKENKDALKFCFDQATAEKISQEVPDLLKKSVQKNLVTKCYCFEITHDLKQVLELTIDKLRKQGKS